jgi:hypothetical protein
MPRLWWLILVVNAYPKARVLGDNTVRRDCSRGAWITITPTAGIYSVGGYLLRDGLIAAIGERG